MKPFSRKSKRRKKRSAKKADLLSLSDSLWMIRERRAMNRIPLTVPRRRMPIPQTREELIALGWKYSNDGRCDACQEPIEWWVSPKNTKHPMRRDPDGKIITHFADCPFADKFRRKKK